MAATVERLRIELLVDEPLVRRVIELSKSVGVTGYTLLPTLGGEGHRGRWSDDQVTGAEAKVLFLTITTEDKADALIEALAPLLDSHGIVLTAGVVNVVRGEKF